MEKETAAEVFGRLKFPDQNDFQLSFLSELQPGRVLELLGEPSSGKSQVLMTAVAECVMHPDARAVFIDLDDKLSLLRLVDVIESHLRYSTECSEEQMSATALEQATVSVLGHITMLTPTTAQDVLDALDRVDALFWDRSDSVRFSLICVDGIDAFFNIEEKQMVEQMTDRIAQCAREFHIPALVSRRLFRRHEEDADVIAGEGDQVKSEILPVGFLGKHWPYVVGCSTRLEPFVSDDVDVVRAISTNTATEAKTVRVLFISGHGVEIFQSPSLE